MTRQRSDRARNAPVERPEPLGRPSAAAVAPNAIMTRLMRYAAVERGEYPPLTSNADAAAIRRAERWRDRELAADPEWWTGEGPDRD